MLLYRAIYTIYIAIYFNISFKVQVIKSSIKWFVNIRELPLKSIGKENICKRTSRTVWSNPSKSVAYIHIYRLRKWLIYMRRNPLSWIMKRLFCRREAWRSWRSLTPTTMGQPSNIMSPHARSRWGIIKFS